MGLNRDLIRDRFEDISRSVVRLEQIKAISLAGGLRQGV